MSTVAFRDKIKLSIFLTPVQVKEIKKKALNEGISVSKYIERLIFGYPNPSQVATKKGNIPF